MAFEHPKHTPQENVYISLLYYSEIVRGRNVMFVLAYNPQPKSINVWNPVQFSCLRYTVAYTVYMYLIVAYSWFVSRLRYTVLEGL